MPRTSPASRLPAPPSGGGGTAGRDNAESTEDFSPSWICWLVAIIFASYISYELLSEGSRRISDESPGGQGSYAEAEDGASAQGSLELDFESPFSLRGADASFLAEDPAQVFSSNFILDAAKCTIQSFLAEKLLLRCRVLSSLLNASLCACRPSQGEMWPMCPLMSVVGRPYGQHTQAVVAKRRMANIRRPWWPSEAWPSGGRDGQEPLGSLGATP